MSFSLFCDHLEMLSHPDLYSKAFDYARMGDAAQLEELLCDNSNLIRPDSLVSDPDYPTQTLMQIAAMSNSKECMTVLYKHGAQLTKQNYLGFSPLHFASYTGAADAAEYILSVSKLKSDAIIKSQNPLVEMRTIDGKTPLHVAASRGHICIMEKLINAGCDLNACDSEGKTALFDAIVTNQREAVDLLVLHGANVFHMTADKETPSSVATSLSRTWFITKYCKTK